MEVFIDQVYRPIQLDSTPNRIVSLVPSITELLYDFNLSYKIVGRTKFCIHPKEFVKDVHIIGGTKNLRLGDIITLKPDLIIANKEENNEMDVNILEDEIPIWVSDVSNLQTSFNMIEHLGKILKEEKRAAEIIDLSKATVNRLKKDHKQKAIYLIWQNPYMTVGGDTYINDMMFRLGYENLCAAETRYPQIEIADMQALQPEVILLSSEPFPFKEKHIKELKEFLPKTKIELVDGELYSWYGSRLLHK